MFISSVERMNFLEVWKPSMMAPTQGHFGPPDNLRTTIIELTGSKVEGSG
jgi:hypothetical protein